MANCLTNKKASLLRQKILTQAHIAHNSCQYRIEALSNQIQNEKGNLNSKLEEVEQRLSQVVSDYQAWIDELRALTEAETSSTAMAMMTVAQIKAYLNLEKTTLKELLELFSNDISIEQNSEDKLHGMLRQQHLQTLLKHVYEQQLKKEVSFLEGHVIGSGGLIFVPDEYMSEQEQEKLNNKIDVLLAEVERVVGLEVTCAKKVDNGSNKKMMKVFECLEDQRKRLQKASRLISQEEQQVSQTEKWVNSFPSFLGDLPTLPMIECEQLDFLSVAPQPEEQELILISSLHSREGSQNATMTNLTCIQGEVEELTKSLKRRLKKWL